MPASLRTLSWTSRYIRDDCRALNPFRNGDLSASIEGSLHSKDRRRHGKGRMPSDGHSIRGPNYSIISTLGKSITAVMRRTAATDAAGIGSRGMFPFADAQLIRRSDLL